MELVNPFSRRIQVQYCLVPGFIELFLAVKDTVSDSINIWVNCCRIINSAIFVFKSSIWITDFHEHVPFLSTDSAFTTKKCENFVPTIFFEIGPFILYFKCPSWPLNPSPPNVLTSSSQQLKQEWRLIRTFRLSFSSLPESAFIKDALPDAEPMQDVTRFLCAVVTTMPTSIMLTL